MGVTKGHLHHHPKDFIGCFRRSPESRLRETQERKEAPNSDIPIEQQTWSSALIIASVYLSIGFVGNVGEFA